MAQSEWLAWRTTTTEEDRADLGEKVEENPLETPEDAKRLLKNVLAATLRGDLPPSQLEAAMPLIEHLAIKPHVQREAEAGGSFAFRVTQERVELVGQVNAQLTTSSKLHERRKAIEARRSALTVIDGEEAKEA